MMSKKNFTEARARIGIYDDVLRVRVPAPVVTYLGGRKGDYIVFTTDAKGGAAVSIKRTNTPKKETKVMVRKR
jgi:hypothetical protein